ncbi:hypothetical protein N781_08895 [Pontibacillus halophilus JSM 076056 = DSM 19796]|uniref:Uncharacterized protein n=1 Tax=Pontibacillus halophilus JSM 076056 = DSM 19796 TaxID=1385510 RepID=A0A0A5GCR5_9BACI|nr:YkyB family protein [Pontibacillus halophilus]KGX89824.1 hypothetical protein N781_08895 [Pontibacillus halophilus JSM 076056 = DSM 19796]
MNHRGCNEDILILCKSLYTINHYAKFKENKKELYKLKDKVIRKLIKEGKATVIGLQYSRTKSKMRNHSVLLIEISGYYFHIYAINEEFNFFPHLGEMSKKQNNLSKVKYITALKMLNLYLEEGYHQ